MKDITVRRTAIGAALALAAMASGGTAAAKSIQVDEGGGTWEQNFANVLDGAGDTGEVTLPFTFMGANTMFISARGAVGFGAPINNAADLATAQTPWLAPLLLGGDPDEFFVAYDWGGKQRNCDTTPASCGPDGERQPGFDPNDPYPVTTNPVSIDTSQTTFADQAFRVTWTVTDANNDFTQFQMAVWKLLNGDFVVSYNYGQLQWGLPGSLVGFDLGAGLEFDASTVNYIDLAGCITQDDCAPGENYVWPGFPPGAVLDAFFSDIFGDPITGRAVFYIDADNSTVPEPASFALLLAGGLGLFAARRRWAAKG